MLIPITYLFLQAAKNRRSLREWEADSVFSCDLISSKAFVQSIFLMCGYCHDYPLLVPSQQVFGSTWDTHHQKCSSFLNFSDIKNIVKLYSYFMEAWVLQCRAPNLQSIPLVYTGTWNNHLVRGYKGPEDKYSKHCLHWTLACVYETGTTFC